MARLLQRGPDAFLKKIGEEATEVVMAAKDVDPAATAQSWWARWPTCGSTRMIALAHYGLTPADVMAELERREGTSGIEEKALRKAQDREASDGKERTPWPKPIIATVEAEDSLDDRTVMHVLYGMHTVAVLPALRHRSPAGDRADRRTTSSATSATPATWQASQLHAGAPFVCGPCCGCTSLTPCCGCCCPVPGWIAWTLISALVPVPHACAAGCA